MVNLIKSILLRFKLLFLSKKEILHIHNIINSNVDLNDLVQWSKSNFRVPTPQFIKNSVFQRHTDDSPDNKNKNNLRILMPMSVRGGLDEGYLTESYREPCRKPYREPCREPCRKPYREPCREPCREPYREPCREHPE